MKIRNDSPFAKLTPEQLDSLAESSKGLTTEQMMEVLKGSPEPIRCTLPALRRFLQRLRLEQLVKDREESREEVEALAARGDGKVRDAALAAAQEKMFQLAVDTNHREALMETYSALHAEKVKERELLLEERKVAVAEENARVGRRKLELEAARSGLKLLPKVREILMDANLADGERVTRALECLGREGGKLLAEGTGG